jgi:hypothetical protein
VCIKIFFENRAIYEIMWKNIVERGRPQVTIWRMCTACWILIAFPPQQWLHERASVLCYTYIACLAIFYIDFCWSRQSKIFLCLRCGSHANFYKVSTFQGSVLPTYSSTWLVAYIARVHDVSVQMTSLFIDTALTTLILSRRSSLQKARTSLCILNTVCGQLPHRDWIIIVSILLSGHP